MNKERIEKRLEELLKENDEANEKLKQLNISSNQIVQEILIRNGRILELKRMEEI